MNIDWFQVVLSLGSGVIGSVIGAGATVWATGATVRETTRQSNIAEEARAKREEKERIEQAKNWIHAELLQINEMAKDLPRNRKFPNSAWESTKMYLYWWKQDEQKALIGLYNEIALYNEEINYGMHSQGVQRNHGGQLASIGRRLRPALNKAIETLKVVIPQ